MRLPPPGHEVDEEIRYHLECTEEALRREGMDPEAARAEARRRFGDVDTYRRRLVGIERRRMRMRARRGFFEAVAQNVRFAVRSLRRSPGFAAAVILTLALGVGANAAMFDIVDRLLLSAPRHVADADDVRRMYVRRLSFRGETFVGSSMTLPDVHDLRGVPGVAAVAAYADDHGSMRIAGGAAERIRVTGAEAELFDLLGVRPVLGRFFGPDEDRVGVPGTAVISHALWERRFGSDRAVLGTVLSIGEGEYTVVGVAPAGFTGAGLGRVDVWVPLSTAAQHDGNEMCLEHRGCYWVRGMVRIEPGREPGDVALAATDVHRAARAESTNYDPAAEVLLGPIQEALGPRASAESRVARWVAGVSLLVLLIACANVANLLIARGTRRHRELAVRGALGVSRRRLLGEMLTESFVLASLATGAALVLARWGGEVLRGTLLPEVYFPGGTPARLVVFAAVATVVTALLAGLLPALQGSRADVADALRGASGATAGRSRVRRLLLAGQAGLSAVLLVGAGLFVRSLAEARSLDLGWDAGRMLVAELEFEGDVPGAERTAVHDRALERLAGLPAVSASASTYTIPFWSSIAVGLSDPARDSLPDFPTGGPYVNVVSDGYFEAMGLELVRGRVPAPRVGDEALREMVVNESMARVLWPDVDALGQCLVVSQGEACTQVVGIVEDHRRQALEEDRTGLYFLPQGHPDVQAPAQALMIRTAGSPGSSIRAVRDVLATLDPRVRWVDVRPMDELVAPHLRSWRLGATMLTIFGALALAVAGVGLYSVLAFDVARRRRELGVRAALGAPAHRLVRMVLGRGVLVSSLGLGVGLATAALVGRWVEPLLFRVSPWDPLVYGTVALTLLAATVVAGLVPALRTTRLDPTEALRSE